MTWGGFQRQEQQVSNVPGHKLLKINFKFNDGENNGKKCKQSKIFKFSELQYVEKCA